jgi:hypothetical protein
MNEAEPDVLVSYSRADETAALSVIDFLQAEGFSVWWDGMLEERYQLAKRRHWLVLRRSPRTQSYRGNSLAPISAMSTLRAHWRPSRMAQTTRLWPRRMSPQANTPGSLVA